MVRLSPKALRFAEDAARDLIDAPRETWATWSANRNRSQARRPSEGYVDVPDVVAAVLFSAVEQRIGRMEKAFEREDDPEIGNDIAFLRTVSGTLQTELRQASETKL